MSGRPATSHRCASVRPESSPQAGLRHKSASLLRASGLGFGDAKSIHELCAVRACRCRYAVAVAHRHSRGTVPLDVASPVFHLEAWRTLSVRYGDGGAERGEKKKKGASSPHCFFLCKRAAGGRSRMPTVGENRKSRCARQGWRGFRCLAIRRNDEIATKNHSNTTIKYDRIVVFSRRTAYAQRVKV